LIGRYVLEKTFRLVSLKSGLSKKTTSPTRQPATFKISRRWLFGKEELASVLQWMIEAEYKQVHCFFGAYLT